MKTATRRGVTVTTGWPWKAVGPPPPTVPNEEEFLDTTASFAYAGLSKNARIAFNVFSNALRTVCAYMTKAFEQLTEGFEMETGDCLLRYVDLVPIDPPYNVWSKNGKENTENGFSPDWALLFSSTICLYVMALGSGGHIFCALISCGGWYQTLLVKK